MDPQGGFSIPPLLSRQMLGLVATILCAVKCYLLNLIFFLDEMIRLRNIEIIRKLQENGHHPRNY